VAPAPALAATGTTSMTQIGVRGSRAFYTATTSDGRNCLGSGPSALQGTASLLCSNAPLLTQQHPAVASVEVEALASNPSDWHVLRIDGWTTSDVSRVEFTNPAGAVIASGTVSGDVFSLTPSLQAEPGTLRAYDAAGNLIFTDSSYTRGTRG